MNFALEIKNLVKFYGRKKVLKGINMRVPEKKNLWLSGINGAGKTTTFGILGGFLKASSGEILKKGKISILPQDAKFYTGRKIISQMRFLAELSGVPLRDTRKKAEEVLEIVGLESQKKSKPEKLSHGMQKRLSIAQSLLGDPEVILFDEPTSGLDPQNSRKIKDLILSLRDQKTVVVSSHVLSEISEICSEIGVIHEGEMHFEGKIDEITKKFSEINFHLSGKINLELLEKIPEISNKDFDEKANILKISFNDQKISTERMNEKIFSVLQKEEIGIREVHLGKNLEESFFELLGS